MVAVVHSMIRSLSSPRGMRGGRDVAGPIATLARRRSASILARIAFAALAIVACSDAAMSEADGAFLSLGREIGAPSAAIGLCTRYRWACGTSARNAHLSRAALSDSARVNRQVNRAVRSVSDRRQYGTTDYWALPSAGAGDCEDFALAKKLELIKRGYPPNRLLLATVHSRRTGAHAVLILRLDEGDYVLDSLHDDIRHWRSTGYTFLRVQSPTSPGTWRAGFANAAG